MTNGKWLVVVVLSCLMLAPVSMAQAQGSELQAQGGQSPAM